MDNEEIALHLTVATVEWLEGIQSINLPRDAESIGGSVAKLYNIILKNITT